jgi:hypothetical protein
MTSPTVQRRRRRRVLALATAGLALCIGVSVTSLAAWQQSINVTPGANAIGSSLLRIELSLDGGTSWNTVNVGSDNTIAFAGNPTLLTPGDTTYASVLLRAAAGSRGANVTLAGGSVSDVLVNVLRYSAKIGVARSDCSDANYPSAGSVLVATNTLLTSGASSAPFVLNPGPDATTPGLGVGVCLAVTLPLGVSPTLGGKAASPAWQFVATSS